MVSRPRPSNTVRNLLVAIIAAGLGASPTRSVRAQAVAPPLSAPAPAAPGAEPPASPGPVDATQSPAEPPVPPPPSAVRVRPVIDPEVPRLAPSPPGRRGLAIEIRSTGFLSGTPQGGLMLGYSGDFFVVGLGLNYTRTKSTLGPNPSGFPQQEVTVSGIDVGPAARFRLKSTADRRLELIGAVDFRVQRATGSMDLLTGMPERKLSGFLFSAGPGLRYWIHSRLSIGYTAHVAYSALTGQQTLRSQIDSSTPLDPNMPFDPSTSLDVTTVEFGGAFHLLAVF